MKPTAAQLLSLLLYTCVQLCFGSSSVNAQLINSSTVQQGINPVYLGPAANLTNFNPDDLERLRKEGINRLIVSSSSIAEFNTIVNAFNTNAILNQFKVILSVEGPLFNGYFDCVNNSTCTTRNVIPQYVQDLLQSVVLLAKQNPVVGGYYTFDEPAIYWNRAGTVQGIDKIYQTNAYNYIRNLDPDIQNRPVCVANTMYTLQDNIIDYAMSNDVQDLFFIDQYSTSVSDQQAWFQKWKSHGLTAKPYVLILPASQKYSCDSTNIGSNASALQQGLNYAFQSNPPPIAGIGLFAYWPTGKTDFNYALDNCHSIMEDACNYLSGLLPSPMAEWRLDQNPADSGPLNSTATLVGNPAFSNQYYVEGNGSIFLNGNNQGLQVSSWGGILKDAFAARTLMFWVQPFAASSTQMLYEEGDYGNGIAARINQGSLQVALANFGTDYLYTVPNFTFENGVWHHIAIVFDHGMLYVYVDGSIVYSVTTTSQVGAHWDPAGLGMEITNGGIGDAFGPTDNTPSFNGFFDDLRVYNTAVSPGFISNISQGLFGEWRWNFSTQNDGSGNAPAILQGAGYTTNATIEGTAALYCNGSQQGAELSPWGGFLRAEIKKRTIMFWMTPAALNQYQMLYQEGDGGNGIAIRLNPSNHLEVGLACYGTPSLYTVNSVSISQNSWYFIAVVFNRGTVDIYINNQKVEGTFAYTAINPHWGASATGMMINSGLGDPFGQNDNTGGFSGGIDHLRVYNSIIPEPYLQALCWTCAPITTVTRIAASSNYRIPAAFDEGTDNIHAFLNKGSLTINSSIPLRSYRLLDITGKEISGRDHIDATSVYESIPVLASGIYIIKVTQNTGRTYSIKVLSTR